MTRFLCCTVFMFMCISLPASSQTLIRQYGVKGGVGLSSMTWEIAGLENTGIKSRPGLDAAGYVEWLDVRPFSLVSELHYVQKGMREDIPVTTTQFPDGTGEFYRHDIRLDYVSVVVLPKLRMETGPVEFYMLAGMRCDINLSNKVNVEGQEPLRSVWAASMQSLAGHFRKTQLGATVGAGIQLKSLLPMALGLEVRYSPNLQDAYNERNWSIRTNSFEFLVTLSK